MGKFVKMVCPENFFHFPRSRTILGKILIRDRNVVGKCDTTPPPTLAPLFATVLPMWMVMCRHIQRIVYGN